MSALDAASEVARLAKTSGLKKETVELIELKLSLITAELTRLGDENARLKAEKEKLEIQVKCLEPQHEELSQDTVGILKLFFNQAKDISVGEITAAVKWKQSVVDYHLDVLLKKRFIRETTPGMRTLFGSSEATYGLTTLGRRYVIQYLAP